jgi:acyl carrier protein
MNTGEVLERIALEVSTVRRAAGLPNVLVSPNMSLIEDLGLDSLMFIDLSLALERAFGIELAVQDWADAQAVRQSDRYTVLSLVEWIATMRAGLQAEPLQGDH